MNLVLLFIAIGLWMAKLNPIVTLLAGWFAVVYLVLIAITIILFVITLIIKAIA